MSAWPEIDFSDVVSDETGGNTKTLQSDYLSAGKYPIVDQGQGLIGGFTNDATRVCKAELPVVIFGDHTKCFKFIDFPFCLGADGTKVLRPKQPIDERYLFYALQRIHVPDAGYSRHFKYLKEGKIPVPAPEEQKRIAAILDQADDLRRKRQSAMDCINKLGQVIFRDTFGDPLSSDWNETAVSLGSVCNVSSGSTPSRASPSFYKGKIPWVKTGEVVGGRIKATSEHISEEGKKVSHLRLYDPGTILLAMYGQGKTRGQVAILDIPATINQACAAIVCSDQILPDFLFYQLKLGYDFIRALGRGGNQPNLNASLVRGIPVIVPALAQQRCFVKRVREIELLSDKNSLSYNQSEQLFESIGQQAFGAGL